MTSVDINALFGRAERAFQVREFEAARRDLLAVLRSLGEHPQVLHLLALTEQSLGRLDMAADAFRRGLRLAPRDGQINNNYANLLAALGDDDTALRHFEVAVAVDPGAFDPRYNRALLLQRRGAVEAALADVDRLLVGWPHDPRLWEARGSANRQRGDLPAAAQDFARALALGPDRAVALHGAARVALERGDPQAAAYYARARAAAPDDPALVLGLAEALEANGDPAGMTMLADQLSRNPDWIDGQDSLARMRAEAADPDDFARGYADAVARQPDNRSLHFAYWRCLARGDRQRDALAALDRALGRFAPDGELALIEAALASEAGDLDRADRAFLRAGDGPQAALALGRHMLRRGDPVRAAGLLEPIARADLTNVTAWAHLALAWRLTVDPRHTWLCGQPGLFGATELDLTPDELAVLATRLRDLHRTRAHPIGQSLRGGTQTRGRLLTREEPIIARLRECLRHAVAGHVSAMPPADASHPLLRHRGHRLAFAGSWSVRLRAGGFHVHHIHPEGVLSSACYVALPESLGPDRDGWLEIGAAPVELGLDLPPLTSIEPQPGRLALFPSYMFHGTRPFGAGERLTVAFDVTA
ncbi:MAG: tetratricopeptide repeat protein [Sphingomonas sp.]|uniref:putative 2OG-Fe(II) oxygenase n=1 Tax=Sphingomonas sp. TaxID=28214 RepID=UPI0025F274EB|nr:tetratricopeptide repeat protein [Sphingomonas sp.]MBY0284762.1 tetratricopeptide repeat protein [Sphingomonas sp.]